MNRFRMIEVEWESVSPRPAGDILVGVSDESSPPPVEGSIHRDRE